MFPRRARVYGPQTFASLNSRRESNKDEDGEPRWGRTPSTRRRFPVSVSPVLLKINCWCSGCAQARHSRGQGLGVRASGSGPRGQGLGVRVSGSGSRGQGLPARALIFTLFNIGFTFGDMSGANCIYRRRLPLEVEIAQFPAPL